VLPVRRTCLWLGTLLLLVAFPVWGQTPSTDADLHQVFVSVYDNAGVPAAVLEQAEQGTGKIFARIGLELVWFNCSAPHSSLRNQSTCQRFAWPTYLALRIVPRSVHPDGEVFGTAFLSAEGEGCYSNVFYDQIRALHQDWNVGLAEILGHVAAHELGHLLLGLNAHSSTGIMRAHWQGQELQRMARGNLLFTTEQGERMRTRLIPASSRSAVTAQGTY
jgi:hypothetical protein